MSANPALGENRAVYSPTDQVRIKGDSTHREGTVLMTAPAESKALVRWNDVDQRDEPEQWHLFNELEKLVPAPVTYDTTTPGPSATATGGAPSPVGLSLPEAQVRRKLILAGRSPVQHPPLELAWSDEARKASAAARRAMAHVEKAGKTAANRDIAHHLQNAIKELPEGHTAIPHLQKAADTIQKVRADNFSHSPKRVESFNHYKRGRDILEAEASTPSNWKDSADDIGYFGSEPLELAWSDAAREASAAIRHHLGQAKVALHNGKHDEAIDHLNNAKVAGGKAGGIDANTHHHIVSAMRAATYADPKKTKTAIKHVQAAEHLVSQHGTEHDDESSRWTPDVDKKAEEFFGTLSTAEIRKRQDLATQQMRMAHQQGNTRALEDLDKMHNALTREMLRRSGNHAEVPVYGGHPTWSGQPGGQPVAGPNDTQGQRPQQPPNLKEAQGTGDTQYLTDQMCASCKWWAPDQESAAQAIGMPAAGVTGACTKYHVDTGGLQVCDSWQSRAGYDMAIVIDDTPDMLMLDEGQPRTRFRKVSLRTGIVAAATPGDDGALESRPLEFIDGRSVRRADGTFEKIGFDDIIASIDDPAFERITVPLSHLDKPEENSGFVVGYRKLDDPDRPGQKLLELEHEITEPDVEAKLKRGSIYGSSVGLLFDYVRKTDLKKFDVALKHNALTNVPWVRGLGSHVMASESDGEAAPITTVGGIPVSHVEVLHLTGLQLGEKYSKEQLEKGVKEGWALPDSERGGKWPIKDAEDLGNAKQAFGRSKSSERGRITGWINKHAKRLGKPKKGETSSANAADDQTIKGGDRMSGVQTAPTDAQAAATQLQMSEQSDLIRRQQEQLNQLHADLHRRNVDDTVTGWANKGLDRLPGFLAKARQFMLADDGGPALVLNLSEEDGTVKQQELTSTGLIEALVLALPFSDEGQLNLGAQAFAPDPLSTNLSKPPEKAPSGNLDNTADAVKSRADEVTAELLPNGRIPGGGDQ